MPSDQADEIGAPELPRLCNDHKPVIDSARHLAHVGAGDLERAAESKATSCPQCYALNRRTLT